MFTPTDDNYRLEILNQTRQSARQYIPYDDRNLIDLEQKKFTNITIEGRVQIEQASHDANIWRRVKFLGRSMLNNGLTNMRGLNCSQFVTIMLQNAERRADQTKAINLTGINWISDKHHVDKATVDDDNKSFSFYQKRIGAVSYDQEFAFIPDSPHYQNDDYDCFGDFDEDEKKQARNETGKRWATSAQIWQSSNTTPEEFYKDTVIPVDSKIASPNVLYHIFHHNPDIWGDETIIETPKLQFSQQEKKAWRELEATMNDRSIKTSAEQSVRRHANIFEPPITVEKGGVI